MLPFADMISQLGTGLAAAQSSALAFAVPIAGLAAAGALASELLTWIAPLRDPRARFLARTLGVDDNCIIPIGDGIQLWRDAHRAAADREGRLIPAGSPTLKGSYLAQIHGRLHLIAIHSQDGVDLQTHPDDDTEIEVVVPILDPGSGFAHLDVLYIDIEKDLISRCNLAEALVNTRFGYRGPITPVLLFRGAGIGGETDQTTISGLSPIWRTFKDEALDRPLPSNGVGGFEDATGMQRLARFMRAQPRRSTPRRVLLRRAVILGLSAWIIVQIGAVPLDDGALAALRDSLPL